MMGDYNMFITFHSHKNLQNCAAAQGRSHTHSKSLIFIQMKWNEITLTPTIQNKASGNNIHKQGNANYQEACILAKLILVMGLMQMLALHPCHWWFIYPQGKGIWNGRTLCLLILIYHAMNTPRGCNLRDLVLLTSFLQIPMRQFQISQACIQHRLYPSFNLWQEIVFTFVHHKCCIDEHRISYSLSYWQALSFHIHIRLILIPNFVQCQNKVFVWLPNICCSM